MISEAERQSLDRHSRVRDLLERQKQSNEATESGEGKPHTRLTEALEELYIESFTQGQRLRVLESELADIKARLPYKLFKRAAAS